MVPWVFWDFRDQRRPIDICSKITKCKIFSALELSQRKNPKEMDDSLGSVLSSGQRGRLRHSEPFEYMLGDKLGLSILENLQSIGVIFSRSQRTLYLDFRFGNSLLPVVLSSVLQSLTAQFLSSRVLPCFALWFAGRLTGVRR